MAGLGVITLQVDMTWEEAETAFSSYYRRSLDATDASGDIRPRDGTYGGREALLGVRSQRVAACSIDLGDVPTLSMPDALGGSLDVEEVTLSRLLKSIPVGFVCGCRRLRSVNIGECESLSVIAGDAFNDCWSIDNIVDPPSLVV